MTLPMFDPQPTVVEEQIFVDVSHLKPVINFLAQARRAGNRAKGIQDKKVGSQSGLEIDVRGVAAELCFCMHYNIWPDLELRPRSGGYDCIYKGIKTNVKEAPAEGNLLVEERIEPQIGLAYVLCVGADFQYKIAGWCWSDELINYKNLRYWDESDHEWIHISLGHPTKQYPPTYVLTQHSLRKMSDFGN